MKCGLYWCVVCTKYMSSKLAVVNGWGLKKDSSSQYSIKSTNIVISKLDHYCDLYCLNK